MASSINADNGVVSGSSGLKSTADTSGVLALQSNGTTGLTLNTSLALGVGSGNSTGSSGQVLTSQGSGAAPIWAAAGGSSATPTALGTVYGATGTGTNAFGGYNAGVANTSGIQNTAFGSGAFSTNTTASANAAFGSDALRVSTGDDNTAVGARALYTNSTGSQQTAVGRLALYLNTTGTSNTAVGQSSLQANTTGSYNTAMGVGALTANTTASNNTAVGYQAGYSNITATNNTIVGYQAGYSVTNGGANTFIGYKAGYTSNVATPLTDVDNTFVGSFAGFSVTTGTRNTFIGGNSSTGGAGYSMTTGSKNTIIGAYNGNQDGLDIRTASNYAVISDGDGNRLLSTANGYSLALDGGAVPQSGTGITFPATQSASSDANTLDDYEEGSWTPSVSYSAGNGDTGYVVRYGSYTKVGRMVTCTGYIWFNESTASGYFSVSGLPFTSVGGGTYGYFWYGIIASNSLTGYTNYFLQVNGGNGGGTTTAAVYGNSGSQLTNANTGANTVIQFSVTYETV